MDQTHITDEDLREALDNYRWALSDALSEVGDDAPRDEIITHARKMLAEEDPEQHELIVELANSDSGDPVWSLEEEIVDDEAADIPGLLPGADDQDGGETSEDASED